MFDVGDTLPFSARLYDAPPEDGGQPVNAVSATLTVTLPDGTSPAPISVSPAAVGVYQHDYVSTLAGQHIGRWLFAMAGGKTTSYVETFDVREANPGYIVSLTDTKRHLNIPASSTVDDEELRGYIEAATKVVENYRDEVIVRRTVVDQFFTEAARRIWLRSVPVISLTSIARADASYTWDPLSLLVDTRSGAVTVSMGPSFYGDLISTYVAGYQVIPANYTLAAKIIIGHLWEIQRQPSIGAAGFFGSGDAEAVPSGLGFAVPNRAIELLGRRPPVVA